MPPARLLLIDDDAQLIPPPGTGFRPVSVELIADLLFSWDAHLGAVANAPAFRGRQVARGGPERSTDEELGIIKTDDTVGRIAADASQEIRSRLSRLMSRFGRRGRK